MALVMSLLHSPSRSMTVEQLQAYAREHYGENPDEEADADTATIGDDDDEEEDDDDEDGEATDDYFENMENSGYQDDLIERGLKLWLVRCRRRRERSSVRKINRMVKTLKRTKDVGAPSS